MTPKQALTDSMRDELAKAKRICTEARRHLASVEAALSHDVIPLSVIDLAESTSALGLVAARLAALQEASAKIQARRRK